MEMSPPLVSSDIGTRAPVHRHGSLSFGVSGLYLALYIHYGFFGFLPLWLNRSGAAPQEIGVLVAIPMVLRLVTVAPFSAWAGRRGRVRDAIMLTAFASAALILLLLGHPDHAGRVAIVVIFSIVWDQIPVLTDAYAVLAVRSRGLDFGRLRVWGSIGAVASSALAGWAIGVTGINALPIMIAALLLAPVAVVFMLPRDHRLASRETASGGRWRDVVRDPALLRAMMATSLVMGSQGVLTSFSAIQWTGRGLSTNTVGLLQALAISAEILGFVFGSKLLGRRDPRLLILVAGITGMARWAIMAFNPGLPLLIVAQLLNGPTAAGAILGVMLVIAGRVADDLSAAAQGLNAVLLGIVLAASTAGSGLLWAQGIAPSYLAMAVLAGCGAALAWMPARRETSTILASERR